MLAFFFSFHGRLSRRQYWRGMLLTSVALVPAFTVAFLMPGLSLRGTGILVAAMVLAAGASAASLAVRRAHDLGKPAGWIVRPLSSFQIAFSQGQAHENQYGPVPQDSGRSLRPGRWGAGLGLVAIVLFGIVGYAMFAGPSLKWPDCKPAVTAEGGSTQSARDQWRRSVASLYGPAYAESGLTVLQSTSCTDRGCTFSARPCVQRP